MPIVVPRPARVTAFGDLAILGIPYRMSVQEAGDSTQEPSRDKLPGMTALVRLLVVWLLTLALPVQGFAAAAMLHCAGGHHDSAAAVTAGVHDHAMHMHASVAVSGTPEMASSYDESASRAASVETDRTPSPAATKHPKVVLSKCSACAVCCAVAYLPTAVLAFPPSVPAEMPATVESQAPAAFFTDGPDRPPRLFLV